MNLALGQHLRFRKIPETADCRTYQLKMTSITAHLLIATAVLFMLFVASDGYDGWEKHWRRYKLTKDQAKVAKQRMKDSIPRLRDLRKASLGKVQPLESKYEKIDFKISPIRQRAAPLCRLFITKPGVTDGKMVLLDKPASCTCFFVKPNVAMTAGHCVFPTKKVADKASGKEIKVALDVSPQAGYVTFLVLDYGVESDVFKNAKRVVEWWTAQKFDALHFEKPNGVKDADLAFLKVSTPIPESSCLTLTQPNGPFGGNPSSGVECNFFMAPTVAILGYPCAYKHCEVALDVVGKIETSKDRLNEITFLGTPWRNGPTKGSIGGGASGGPFVMGEDTGEMPKGCDMGVFGVNYGRCVDDDILCRNNSPLITKALIQALNIIDKVPIAPTEGTAVGATVSDDDVDDNIQLLELTIE